MQANSSQSIKNRKRKTTRPQKNPNKKKGVNTRPNVGKPRAHLSECALRYALALSNPFALDKPPCVPDDKVTPSYKFSVRARSNFFVGTQGVGFVAFAPKRFGNDFAAQNRPIVHSLATYAATTMGFGTGATISQNNLGRFPYTVSQFGDGAGELQVRLVGAAVRIYYTGTELNRGGSIIAFREPNNQSVNTLGAGDVYNWHNTKTCATDHRKHTVCWRPISPSDTEYTKDPHDLSTNNVLYYGNESGPPCMGFMIDGGVTGNSYNYEIISHYEVLGTSIRATKSHSDGVGMSAILTAIPPVIETISSVYTGDVIKGAVKAIESLSGVYMSIYPPDKDYLKIASRPEISEL